MTLSKPYDFAAGTIISDSEVDTNFDTLFSAIGTQMYTEENYVANDQSVTASIDALDMKVKDLELYGLIQRGKFTYNGGSTAYTVKVGAAVYYAKGKHCFWNIELTTNAIAAPVASTRYYLYLDHSAITSGIAITATELIWSTTAPTWDGTYRGWYNGDDRCIFAVKTNSGPTNIYEFFHSGDYVQYADLQSNPATLVPSTTWTDVVLYMPAFATRAQINITHTYVDTVTYAQIRTNGQTGSVGHVGASVSTTASPQFTRLDMITDSAQTIEVRTLNASANGIETSVDGWYFPIGM